MQGISGLVEDAVTAFVTTEGRNEISRAAEGLEAIPQGLLNKLTDEKWRPFEFENRLFSIIRDVKLLPWRLKRMMDAMLDSLDFIAQLAPIVKNQSKEAVDVKSYK